MATGFTDWQGNKAGVIDFATWAVFRGKTRHYGVSGTAANGGYVQSSTYDIDEGEIVFITHTSGAVEVDGAGMAVALGILPAFASVFMVGGQQGVSASFSPPLTVAGPATVAVRAFNYSSTAGRVTALVNVYVVEKELVQV